MNKIISIERLTAMTSLIIFENGSHCKHSNRELVEAITNKDVSMENVEKIYDYFTKNLKFSRPLVMQAKTNYKIRETLEKNK